LVKAFTDTHSRHSIYFKPDANLLTQKKSSQKHRVDAFDIRAIIV